MLIVLEGPDRCGKSTLADRISERTGAKIWHKGPPQQDPLVEYGLPIEGMYTTTNAVLDRWHIGQMVYPHLYPEGRTPLEETEQLWIEMVLKSRGAVLVHVTDETDAIRERVEQDPDSYLKPEDVAHCRRLFFDAVSMSILPRLGYKHGDPIDDLIWVAKSEAYASQHTMNLFPNVIGSLDRPEILLVGDHRSPTPSPHYAPFAPYFASSGEYLMSALLLWPKVSQRKIAITSIYAPQQEGGDIVNIEELWLRLDRPRIVAMGLPAISILDRLRLPFGQVGDPRDIVQAPMSAAQYAGALATAGAISKVRPR